MIKNNVRTRVSDMKFIVHYFWTDSSFVGSQIKQYLIVSSGDDTADMEYSLLSAYKSTLHSVGTF